MRLIPRDQVLSRGAKEVRLKALNVNLDLKVSGNAPEGAKRLHLTVLIMVWRLKALRTNLDLKVSRDAPEGASRGHLTVLRRVWRLKALNPILSREA